MQVLSSGTDTCSGTGICADTCVDTGTGTVRVHIKMKTHVMQGQLELSHLTAHGRSVSPLGLSTRVSSLGHSLVVEYASRLY